MYSCGNWCINFEFKRRISVCSNRSIRCIFGYYDFEYAKDTGILFGSVILPITIYIVKTRLGLLLISVTCFMFK